MPSNKPQVKSIITNEEYAKFKYIADSENRSISNLLQLLVKDKISKYEAEHGTISVPDEQNT